MLRALLWKEFRELMPLWVGALAAELLLAGMALNGWRLHRSADVWSAVPLLYVIAVIISICLGYWQNSHESSQNTFQFLLTRPLHRPTVFFAKLLFGLIVCLLFGVIPLLAFTEFAQSTFPDPFVPPQTTWGVCVGIWLLYGGAFLSGLRPASIYARYLPLVAGIFLFTVLQLFYSALMPWHPIWAAGVLLLTIPIAASFIFAALYVGSTRDYS